MNENIINYKRLNKMNHIQCTVYNKQRPRVDGNRQILHNVYNIQLEENTARTNSCEEQGGIKKCTYSYTVRTTIIIVVIVSGRCCYKIFGISMRIHKRFI